MPEGPTFVGVGSRLSGFRWWGGLLAEHPDVWMPESDADGERGMEFFERFCEQPMTDADVDAYRARFPAGAGAAGEWSVRYMTDPWIVPLLARAVPDAKLLVLLGDPIERTRNRLTYADTADPVNTYLSIADALERARYATQLRWILDCFDRSQVLVQQQERCEADPVGEFRRLLAFVGVDEGFLPPSLARVAAGKSTQRGAVRVLGALGVNGRVPERVRRRLGLPVHRPPAAIWPDLADALHAEIDPEIAALAELVPDLDLSVWPNFAHLAHPTPATP